ncbi:MAG TPA: hypothetical protein VKV23_07250 [Acidimicrobiales bacterium]|nr:hypothetical protein [Acidimicrobiales bacterium]
MVVSPAELHELAARRGEPVTTTLYLDVDGRRRPRHASLAGELAELARAARAASAELDEEARDAVAAELARIEAWFASGVDRRGLRGLAVFSSTDDGDVRVVPLAAPVSAQAHVGEHAHLGQLVAALGDWPPTLVALVDDEHARLFHLELGEIEEHEGPVSEHARRVDTDTELGAFERRAEEAVRRHLRAVSASVEAEVARSRVEWVVLAGPSGPALAEVLAPATRRLVAGVVPLEVRATAAQVAKRVRPVVEAAIRARRRALLASLADEAGAQGRAAIGLADTVTALEARDVEALVVRRGYHVPGVRCPACGLLQERRATCARCGAPTRGVGDLVGEIIAEALLEGADVEIVDEPVATGSIGVLERH